MICSQCQKCGKCGKPYSSNSNYAERCKDFQKKKITNFEKIKSMTIDEMTEQLFFIFACDNGCPVKKDINYDCLFTGCKIGIKKWLESEAVE